MRSPADPSPLAGEAEPLQRARSWATYRGSQNPSEMIEKHTPGGGLVLDLDPTRSGRRAFNHWLQVQLHARKLSQRQLAQKSGVDHSTISRLIHGDRVPSLRTATMLAHGLGIAQLDGLQDQNRGRSGSPMASVEYALRSDDLLNETEVREIMNVYLAARLRRPPSVATPDPAASTRSTLVPLVVGVPETRLRSTSSERLPTASRGRSS
jgi:transcriptional regulator with XRE-family HTH domain